MTMTTLSSTRRTSSLLAPALVLAVATSASFAAPELHAQDRHVEMAHRVLSTTPLFDGHNDLPWAIRNYDEAPMSVPAYDLRAETPGHTDIARIREGMLGAQFWSVYVPAGTMEAGTAARTQLEQIDIALQVVERYPDVFEQARSTSEVNAVFGQGKVASVLGMEGGHAIENSLGALRAFFDLGVRYMTLTHGSTIDWADSATDDPVHGGLTAFGEEVVREMNRLGMLVDLSHVSPEAMHDALDVTEAPVIFSHSSAMAVVDHPRNVPDDVLERLPENGGVIMITFVPSFVSPEVRIFSQMTEAEREGHERPRATMDDVIRHIEHVRNVAGVEHVGIGSDFDGISSVPVGLEDVSTFPDLFAALSRRGWTERELRMLAGENVLRAWSRAEETARRLQRLRDPSTATIEEMDGAMGQGAGS